MSTASHKGVEIMNASGIRGCGTNTLRLTRKADGASVLMHQLNANLARQLPLSVATVGVPDFSAPFTTKSSRCVRFGEQHLLIEPLPPAVSLIDLWRSVLMQCPAQAAAVVKNLIRQLQEILHELARHDQQHGAVCAGNIVLTDRKTYGLLAAKIETGKGQIWLRPTTHDIVDGDKSTGISAPWDPHQRDSLVPVLKELCLIEARMGALTACERAELTALCDADNARRAWV